MQLSELDLNLGALEIGVLMSSTLWGVTTVQLYVYMTNPNNDNWWTKTLVYIVWILESLHTIFVWYYIYRLTVTFYGVPAALDESNWALDVSSSFNGIIGTIVQMFFAYRIRTFANFWYITLISWLGSMVQLATTTAITVITGRFTIAEFAVRFGWLVETALIVNLCVDVINTAALSYYLNRGRTGFKGTDATIEKLAMWTVETGLITAVAAVLQVVLFKSLPTSALWIGISFFYAKLYSNSFLAILNSRSVLRTGLKKQGAQTSSAIGPGNSGMDSTRINISVQVVQQDDHELNDMHRKRNEF